MSDDKAKTELLTQPQVAKEFLDLVRASLNTFTWCALSIGVILVLWKSGWNVVSVLVGLVAVSTAMAAILALAIYAWDVRKRVLPSAHWLIWLPLAFFAPTGLIFFAFVAVVVVMVPVVNNLQLVG